MSCVARVCHCGDPRRSLEDVAMVLVGWKVRGGVRSVYCQGVSCHIMSYHVMSRHLALHWSTPPRPPSGPRKRTPSATS